MFLVQFSFFTFLVHSFGLMLEHHLSARKFLLAVFIVALEVMIASVVASLLQTPVGEIAMHSCGMSQISDWYPYLHNPRPRSTYTLHCANEAAFPLVTWILTMLAINLILIFVLRWPVFEKAQIFTVSHRPMFTSLYAMPILAIVCMIFGGLIYYAFPYFFLFTGACIIARLPENGLTPPYFTLSYLLSFFGVISLCFFFGLRDGLYWIVYTLVPFSPLLLQASLKRLASPRLVFRF